MNKIEFQTLVAKYLHNINNYKSLREGFKKMEESVTSSALGGGGGGGGGGGKLHVLFFF